MCAFMWVRMRNEGFKGSCQPADRMRGATGATRSERERERGMERWKGGGEEYSSEFYMRAVMC